MMDYNGNGYTGTRPGEPVGKVHEEIWEDNTLGRIEELEEALYNVLVERDLWREIALEFREERSLDCE